MRKKIVTEGVATANIIPVRIQYEFETVELMCDGCQLDNISEGENRIPKRNNVIQMRETK